MTPDATAWIWERLHRPFDEVHALRALLGFGEGAARHLLARLLLETEQARALLDATPGLIRVLRNQQGSVVRVEASIRGLVLWPETISHRAASGFQDDLYVCSTAVRDYDVAENRALAAALEELRRAGRLLDAAEGAAPSGAQIALVASARRAGDLGRHARLRRVPTTRPSARDLAKVRTGAGRRSYGPAVDLLDRAAAGPALAEVLPFVDRRNAAHHALLHLVATEVERTGTETLRFRTWRGQLFCGHLRYLPPGERGGGQPAGVVLDDLAFVLQGTHDRGGAQALTARYPRHRLVPVADAGDVRRALDPGSRSSNVRPRVPAPPALAASLR